MDPNLENEGAKGCYQIVKSNFLESTRLTMSSFLLLYGLLVHPVEYLIGLIFNCVFRITFTMILKAQFKLIPIKYTIGLTKSQYSKRNDDIVKRVLSKSFDFTI